MFRRLASAAVGVAFLLLMSGCVEVTQTFTLNPNGSGKVKYDLVMPAELGTFDLGDKKKEKTPQELLQAALEKSLTKSKGVTAWKDVSIKWTDDGRLHFVGTAYF